MSSFRKFDPAAFRAEPALGGAKVAKLAKDPSNPRSDLSSLSNFSSDADRKAESSLTANKAGDWTEEDWRASFDERAGIAEHDGGLTRAEAEKQAFEATVVEWRNRHPRPSAPFCCASCGKAVAADAVVLPMPAPTWGQLWVHAACWPAWTAARQAEAIAALAALGIRGTMEGADHGDQ